MHRTTASRTPLGSRKRTSRFAGCTFTSTARGIELNKKERNRILPLHKSCVVAFADGAGDKIAFNRTPVYEHELLAACLSAETCLTDKTTDLNFWGGSAVHFDQALQQFRRRISPGSDRRALR